MHLNPSGEMTAPIRRKDSEGGAMSDEQRKDEEAEVEAHRRHLENEEPAEDEADDEVEAHVRKAQPKHI